MLSTWFDRLSEGHPQLWREIKGRVNVRSFGVATAASLLGQWLLVQGFWPQAEPLRVGDDRLMPIVRSTLEWRLAMFDLLNVLTWISLWLLFSLGSYLLARNLVQEIRGGTLLFLRLSGYPAGKILLGKALGVPILLHWAIVLALPLQLWAASQANLALATIGIDALAIVLTAGTYVMSMQTVLESGKQARPWMVAIGANFIFLLCFSVGQAFVWLIRGGLVGSVSSGSGTMLLLLGLSLLLWLSGFLVLCWMAAVRRFRRPLP